MTERSTELIADIYPLTPLQQGMLFHSLFAPEESLYFSQVTCTLRGPLDAAAFRAAWDFVLQRHDVLRSTFAWEDVDEPVQIVWQDALLPWFEEDWRGLERALQERRFKERQQQDCGQGFDFSQPPLLRLTLVRVEDAQHWLLFSSHHLLIDGWSLGLLFREVMATYHERRAGAVPTAPAPRPYRDYIAWLLQQDLRAAEGFWRRQLGDFAEPTPLDLEPPWQAEREDGDLTLELNAAAAARLEELARECSCTRAAVAHAAFGWLLARYSGPREVLFGTTVAGRPTELAGVENMVGLFINTLPLRLRPDGRASVRDWLGAVQRTLAELRQYEFTALTDIQRWSGVPAGQSLFEALLVFENFPLAEVDAGPGDELVIADVHGIERTNFPLTLVVAPGLTWQLRLLYDGRRFTATAAARFLQHFATLLESFPGAVSTPVRQLCLLSPAQRQEVLARYDGGPSRPPPFLDDLVSEAAARTPDAIALETPARSLSFATLWDRVEAAARRLRQEGVGPEVRVGVAGDRSPEMVIAALAVLRAGGAYVPLDPDYPPPRRAYMLADAGVQLLLTGPDSTALWPAGVTAWQTADLAAAEQPVSTRPPLRRDLDQLAYVIYTSGSTGRPKGVLVSHGAAAHTIVELARSLLWQPGQRVLQLTSPSFDVSVLEIFATLAVGATLCLESRDQLLPGAPLQAALERRAITNLVATASTLATLDADRLPAVSCVVAGGEVCPAELVRRWRERRLFWHAYGPTETAIQVTTARCDATTTRRPPLGRPLAGVQLFVLDEEGAPVPAGICGELCIAGPGLARGYHGHPGRTAAAFVPHPFSTRGGDRLYRTGDLVRVRDDGELDFVGRRDEQVKVRGLRIEPGEIEAALNQHAAVHESTVLACGDRLAAFWIGAEPVQGDVLRSFLAERLPAALLPSRYERLDEMPFTPNGKVDRRALAGRATRPAASPATAAAPLRGPLEETIAAHWGHVLGVEDVAAEDNFFTAGGHSLTATQLIARVNQSLGVELPIRMLFEQPTLRAFAAAVAAARTSPGPADRPALTPLAGAGPVRLSFAQERLWFLQRLHPEDSSYHVPLAVRLRGALRPAALRLALQQVIHRHEALRTVFRVADGEAHQVILPPAALELPLLDLLAVDPAAAPGGRSRWLEPLVQAPFCLEEGPLLRTVLLRQDEGDHVLVMVLHHLICDGWSLSQLQGELSCAYAAACGDSSRTLPPLPVQYPDYSVWQRQLLSPARRQSLLDYWRVQLADLPPSLALPLDRPRPAEPSFAGATVDFVVEAPVVQSLQRLARQEGATLFMTLLAVWNIVLHRYSQERDLAVGTPIAGRPHPDLELLIGNFVNTLVLRTEIRCGATFVELLAEVRAVVLDAFAHDELPFELLVEELQPERDLSSTPLFQVLFVLENTPPSHATLPGLSFEPWQLSTSTAKYDWTLSLVPEDGALRGELEVRSELFHTATAAQVVTHFGRLLAAVADQAEEPLAALPMLSAAERHQLVVTFNDTARDYPRDENLTALWHLQRDARPDAIALEFGDHQLSCAAAAQHSAAWAAQLRHRGVARGDRVLVDLERSLELVLAVMAVVEVGAAYVPLEDGLPAARRDFVIADAAPTLVLTRAARAHAFPPQLPVWCPTAGPSADAEGEPLANVPAAHPATALDVAYVMYTSGSTGKPKGVAVGHRAVARLVLGQDYVQLGPAESVLLFAPFAFDLSTFETWGPLLTGSRLVICAPHLPNLAELAGFVRERGVTTLWLTAGLFHQFAELDPGAFAGLHQLLAGGDILSPLLVRQVLDATPGLRLINGYGPTEATTFTSAAVMTHAADVGATVSIGRPLANTTVYLLDDEGEPVPRGVAGRLHIGGDALAQGYWQRPDLTAERFVPDPFGGAGQRRYDSGDLARHLPDGRLEFLGRRDHQLKIRGFRVELGEIENALRQHPGVADALVLATTDASGSKQLAAYVVRSGEALQIPALRAFAVTRLPAYMVPAAWAVLTELPLTSRGKVNRSSLPPPNFADDAGGAGDRGPQGELATLITALWEEVLGRTELRGTTHFFAAGGHSLLATRLLARVQQRCGVSLPLRSLFEAPTLAAFIEVVQSALGDPADEALPPLVASEVSETSGPWPLSLAQRRLWFLQQWQPASTSYHLPLILRVSGPLDVGAWRRALQQLVTRQRVLRTVFPLRGEEPVQVLAEASLLAWAAVDLAAVPLAGQPAAAEQVLGKWAGQPFDLARDLPVRAILVHSAPHEAYLGLTLHHIAADGWSLAILWEELVKLYQAARTGSGPGLPALEVHYTDYALWQQQPANAARRARQRAHWQECLEDVPLRLDLPRQRGARPDQEFPGASFTRRWSAGLHGELSELARTTGTTLFMTLLAGFQVLLQRYSGLQQFVVGTPVAGRIRREVEDLVGCFVNTLVLRADLRGDPTVAELLDRVRGITLTASAHQELPFEELVEELQPDRDPGRAPLVQVVLALQNAPAPRSALPDVTLAAVELPSRTSKFDLTVSVMADDAGLSVDVEYRRDLFAAAAMQRLVEHYAHLLAALAADPSRPLSELSMLSAAERRQVLTAWNDTDRDYPRHEHLAARFARQCLRQPDAIAVVDGDQHLSYAMLQRQALRHAALLRERGVGPEVCVALLLERSLELVVAVLSVVTAGGVYVPLNPTDPPVRRALLLGRVRPRVVITTTKRAVELDDDVPYLVVDASPSTRPVPALPLAPCDAHHLAYVLFTSGSTGEPKGVAVTHQAVLRLLFGTDFVVTGPGEVWLQAAPLAFDASTLEVWGSLLTGGRLVVMPARPFDTEDLAAILARERITTLWLTAGLFHQLVGSDVRALSPLRQLLAGGDVLNPVDVARVRHVFPGQRFVNGYGPTESTTFAACHLVVDAPPRDRSVPIGRPIANTRTYVLDASGQPLPVGVPGELYIGGDGLARGYFEAPADTAVRFVPHPFASAPGQRLYRTGDRVRWLEDGTLEFLGRLDQQVKVRGFRIELGEVEAALCLHPDVRAAVVVIRGHEADEKQLVALVASDAAELDAAAVRRFLAARLPAYLLPARVVVQRELPLTASGKLKRQALAALDLPAPAEGIDTPPQTATEELVARLFAELLEVPAVNATADFFELGGHSLLATRLTTRLRQHMTAALSLREVFDHPTVVTLARRLDELGAAPAAALPPLRPGTEPGPWPLSFAQQRLWFLQQLDPGSPFYNVPVVLRLRGPVQRGALQAAWQAVMRRHAALRTRFAMVNEEPRQEILSGSGASLRVDGRDLPGRLRDSWLEGLARAEVRRPFSLAGERLVRLVWVDLAADDVAMVLTLHHAVADGWSVTLLLAELAEGYAARLEGRAPVLPELPVQYADFAAWQRRWLSGETLRLQLKYWSERLAAPRAPLNLPTDFPRPRRQQFRGTTLPVALDESTTTALRQLSRHENASLFMTLLAAWQALLARISGQDDVLVGAPVAGRPVPEVEPLVGFFVNTLVHRADFQGDPTFRQHLRRVRERALEAFAHQDLPFEQLVEELRPARDLSRSPLFEVMLVLQNTPHKPLALPGLEVEALEVDTATSRFDLLVTLNESAGGLNGFVEYSTDLFTAATVRRWWGHFVQLAASAAAQPQARISCLRLLTAAEQAQLVSAAPRPAVSAPAVVELVEHTVRQHPDTIAVEAGGCFLSYAELRRRAAALQRQLEAAGAGPEVAVATTLARDLEAAVALLAVWRSGACLVPVDPTYPAERQELILKDSQAAVLLTPGAAPASIRREHRGTRRAPRATPITHAEALAYVVFTSGSTGRPKGVAMAYAALACLVNHQRHTAGFAGGRRTLQFASPSFDVSLQEFATTWCSGGTLILASEDERRDPRALLARLEDCHVERLFVPFVALQQLAVQAEDQLLPDLREVITAGERLQVTPALTAFFERHVGCRLVNQYGPSETHVATAHTLAASPAEWPALPPIGRAVAGTAAYLLDGQGQPLPPGIAGELYLAGDNLARGYQAQPATTAARFLPDPFALTPGARMYRTGDRARRRADGGLEFLGRVDEQLKVRGFRVEPGEIEAVLRRHPDVADAVVVGVADQASSLRLACFYRPRAAATVSAAALRQHLRLTLPESLIPAQWQECSSFPLTASGKVDRRSLAAQLPQASTPAAASMPPRTPLEELVAGVFAEVLQRTAIGAHENFFDLGGHSLLAAQVVSRLQRLLEHDVPLGLLFEHPTVAQLATELAVTLAAGSPTAARPALVPVPRSGDLPLAFAPRRLWLLEQLAPDRALYNVPVALRLTGPLQPAALRAALLDLVERHEALRTTFVRRAGTVCQQIHAPPDVLVVEPRPASPAALQELAHRPMDLQRGPLFRVHLFVHAQGEHVLLLLLHHTICDGWSFSTLLRELASSYAGHLAGRRPERPPLPVQPADHAVWQRAVLAQVEAAQLHYWRQQLGDGVTGLDLPFDGPGAGHAAGPAGVHTSVVAADLLARLHHLGRREGVTLYMTLLAAFETLLARLSGQDDFNVGSPIAGRNAAELEGLVGCFVNTLVLRADLSGDPTFRTVLLRVRRTALGAYQHADLPFERLVEALQPDRDPAQTPLFQVSFALQNTPATEGRFGDLEVLALELAPAAAKFALTLSCREVSDPATSGGSPPPPALELLWEFNAERFHAETVQRFDAALHRLLAHVVEQPDARVAELPLLAAAQRHAILALGRSGETGAPPSEDIAAAVAEQARRQPTRIAVQDQRPLTYGELNDRAAALAQRLRRDGVGPGSVVALLTGRSAATVLAALSVWKAGGAYLPLDPAHPPERLAEQLQDAGVRHVLCRSDLAAQVPTGPWRVATVDPEQAADVSPPASVPDAPLLSPDQPAYVIYTSGSTGRPKGVIVPHRGLANLVAWHRRAHAVTSADCATLLAGPAFDAAVWEIWPYLASGARLCIPDAATRLEPMRLWQWYREQGVTLSFVPTPLAEQLLACWTPDVHPPQLRRLLTGGDRLRRGPPADLPAVLVNHYGPTEDAVVTTWTPVAEEGLPPIGRPLDHKQVYVLDAAGEPVPIGVAGELFIAGAGLALGYLGDPATTAACFLPDPFGSQPGGRCYRTGDRVRWRADGQLEFLGRSDQQVKVRGLRIELGEVEAKLLTQPGIAQAVVVPQPATGPAQTLVAYAVARGTPPAWDAVQASLRRVLTDAMVPSQLVWLDELPLTSNGKLKRSALPLPPPRARSQEPPRTALERRVAAVWEQVLQVQGIGRDDNFFDLGGHSLLLLQVHEQLAADRNAPFPIVMLFQYPTVQTLAAALEEGQPTTDRADLHAAQTRGAARRGAARRRPRRGETS